MLEERSIAVTDLLRPWISDITVARASADTIVLDKPDYATTLTLRSAPGEEPQLMVMGPRTRALYYEGGPGPSCLRARMHPGRAKLLFGRSLRDLVDQVVPLADLGLDAVAIAEATPTATDLVRRAAELLSTNDVQSSAKRLHVSERHLRNLFVAGVGLPPKRFARIHRIRTVIEQGASRPWSELALEAGYYDHSHMTAEFRAIMGVTPKVFFGGGVTPNIHCAGPFKSVERAARGAVA